MAWKKSPVLMSIGNSNKPIDKLDFPAITLCGPGGNLDELVMVPDLKPNEWKQFWKNKNVEIDKNITDTRRMSSKKTIFKLLGKCLVCTL